MSIWLAYVAVVFSVILTALAQLLLKGGVMQAMAHGARFSEPLALARVFLLTPMIWLGVLAMGVSLLTWMAALSRLEVSRAYPFTALGIVLTMIGARMFQGEPITSGKVLGGVLIVAGLVALSRN